MGRQPTLLRITVGPADPSMEGHFAKLVGDYVSPAYPGTEATYATNIFTQHLHANPTSAHERRIVWAARNSVDVVAYIAASHRWDGSVKLGPLVSDPHYFGTGAAAQLLVYLSDHYQALGKTFLYGTYPSRNHRMSTLLSACGWHVNGAIAGLYRDDHECLTSKNLNVGPNDAGPCAPRRSPRWYWRRKRGGSLLLIPSFNATSHQIDQFAMSAAQQIADPGRVAFIRLASPPPEMGHQQVTLVDGSSIVVWRR